MSSVLIGVIVLLFCGLAALAMGRRAAPASACGAAGPVLAAAIGLPSAIGTLLGGSVQVARWAWDVPFASLAFRLDGLSAFFAMTILAVCALAAVYGVQYLWPYRHRKSLGTSWFFFNVLVASMLVVVLADNGVLFLVAWEIMALASFFLVGFEHERAEVRKACWTYLVATHLGTAFLLPMFLLMGNGLDSLDFAGAAFPAIPAATAGVCFLLAVVGFGTKAGIMPFHVWLPEAHPSAPSHVSAVMSGVMIKTGIYGLLRVISLLLSHGADGSSGCPGPAVPPAWWGLTLIGVGVVSGVLGVLLALAQHDLKRLLAYHSVENIGIILLGLGVGMLGLSMGSPVLAVLGFAGGLLHVLNHAIFKSLLFLGAGSVLHATHCRDLDRLGGLAKRMPWTAICFLVGATAICGLPPLNGFVSEFLVYVASFRGLTGEATGPAVAAARVALLATIGGLALIGGLAAACFAKAFGIVFLGEPRTDDAITAHESGWLMRAPMLVLAGACVLIGLLGPWAVGMTATAIDVMVNGQGPGQPAATVLSADASGLLARVSWIAVGLIVAVAALAMLRRRLLAGRQIGITGTWNCGYAAPSARMQYTASSFAQPLVDMFAGIVPTHKTIERPAGLFPGPASFHSHTDDTFGSVLWRPLFAAWEWLLARFRWIQSGGVHLYVLYIAAALVVLLIWKLGA